jgi:serine protease Do
MQNGKWIRKQEIYDAGETFMMRRWWIRAAVSAVAATVFGFVLYDRALRADDPPAPVTKESSATHRRIIKKVLPAVVSIRATAKAVRAQQGNRPRGDRDPRDLRKFFEGPMTPEEFRRFFEEFGQFEFHPPIPHGGFGSGVIIRRDGVVVTNNHVVEGADSVSVYLQDGRAFTASKILRDPKTDVAVIQLDPDKATQLTHAEFGDSNQVEPGDWILAMGSPFGPELSGSVTAGIVSAKGRAPRELDLLYEDFIQTDAAINPGNSGGPIVNLDGQIVGINTAIRSTTGSFAGIGFAIPSNLVADVVSQLLKHGKVLRSYVGIQMETMDPDRLKKLGLKNGVLVRLLTQDPPQTPAKKAGLQPGDIIVQVDGKEVNESKALQNLVTYARPGSKLVFKVHRGEKVFDVPVVVEEQPEEFGLERRAFVSRRQAQPHTAPVELRNLGIAVTKLTTELARQYGHDADATGVLVTGVDPDSLAAEAGLETGDLIVQAEKKPVASPEDLRKVVSSVSLKDGILLKVASTDGSVQLLVIQEK